MDPGALPDLAAQFHAAVVMATPFIQQIANASADIWTALTVHDAMGTVSRDFQIAKLLASTVGLGLSIAGASIEGAMGCAIADGEALIELERAGHSYREMHPVSA